jgi:hypothetical protein
MFLKRLATVFLTSIICISLTRCCEFDEDEVAPISMEVLEEWLNANQGEPQGSLLLQENSLLPVSFSVEAQNNPSINNSQLNKGSKTLPSQHLAEDGSISLEWLETCFDEHQNSFQNSPSLPQENISLSNSASVNVHNRNHYNSSLASSQLNKKSKLLSREQFFNRVFSDNILFEKATSDHKKTVFFMKISLTDDNKQPYCYCERDLEGKTFMNKYIDTISTLWRDLLSKARKNKLVEQGSVAHLTLFKENNNKLTFFAKKLVDSVERNFPENKTQLIELIDRINESLRRYGAEPLIHNNTNENNGNNSNKKRKRN